MKRSNANAQDRLDTVSSPSLAGLDPQEMLKSIREPEPRDVRVDMRLTQQEWATVQRLAAHAGISTTRLLVGLAEQVDAKLFAGHPADPSNYPRKTDPSLRRKRGLSPSETQA